MVSLLGCPLYHLLLRPVNVKVARLLRERSFMKIRDLFITFAVVAALGCAQVGARRELPPEPPRSVLVRSLIERLSSPEFSPLPGETLYPFTYTFQKANGEEIVKKGRGLVLVQGALWCLVQHWEDRISGNPGERMLVVDRIGRTLEAEVRRWPEGSGERWGNHWTCIRSADEAGDLYLCDYFFPEGTERVLQPSGGRGFYGPSRWNEDGLLQELARFADSSMAFTYEGMKVRRIEFLKGRTMVTFMDFAYP
jgi:hypothetical protein